MGIALLTLISDFAVGENTGTRPPSIRVSRGPSGRSARYRHWQHPAHEPPPSVPNARLLSGPWRIALGYFVVPRIEPNQVKPIDLASLHTE
jgi:hypothetical protein